MISDHRLILRKMAIFSSTFYLFVREGGSDGFDRMTEKHFLAF